MSYLILRASPAFIFVLYLFVNLPDLLSANCEWIKKAAVHNEKVQFDETLSTLKHGNSKGSESTQNQAKR